MKVLKPNKLVTRRSTLRALAATGLAGPYVFTRSAAAQDPKQLSVYNLDGALGKFFEENWIKPFAQENDVKVNIITIVGSSAPLDKLAAQIAAGRPEVDVMILQPPALIFAERNNMMLKLSASDLPETKNFYDGYVTPFGPKLVLWCYGIAYNTEIIKTPPKKWRDLWDARFKGQLGLNDTLSEQAMEMANLAFGRPITPINNETFSALTSLRQNIVSMWTTGAQAEQLFRNREIAISPLWNGRVYNLTDQGVPLDFVVPDEGFFVRWNAYVVARGAKNPELAAKYINFIMGEKRQLAVAEKFYYGSPHKNVKYSTPEIARRVVLTSQENLAKVIPEDFDVISKELPEWTRQWNRWKAS